MLLLGLILCCGAAIVHTFRPNVYVCSVSRIAAGTAYAIVYATLLVKLVFLVSLNGGVYLPATYQSLLLCFAILIQVISRCLKITEKVAFNIANEASNVYIFNGQKFIKIAKNWSLLA